MKHYKDMINKLNNDIIELSEFDCNSNEEKFEKYLIVKENSQFIADHQFLKYNSN